MAVYLFTDCHSANCCIGWLVFVLYLGLHPTPHAALEFIFLTTDSTLGGYSITPGSFTRLSLDARHIAGLLLHARLTLHPDSFTRLLLHARLTFTRLLLDAGSFIDIKWQLYGDHLLWHLVVLVLTTV